MKQTMVIVGLGLIGGSLALALKGFEDFEIVGVDVSQPTLRYAAEHGVGDRVTEDAAAEQDAEAAARARAAELKAAGVRSKDVARAIAEEFGIARNAAYDISLEA